MNRIIRTGALISGGGTNLQAIINACDKKNIDARIVFTGSDNPYAKGLARAEKAGIDTFVVDYGTIIKEFKKNPGAFILPDDFDIKEIKAKQGLIQKNEDPETIELFLKSRAIAEKLLLDRILPYKIDLLILAGFMRTLTPYFIDRINTGSDNHRIMNIHPALLPSFPGTNGYGDTFRYGCKIGGCTVHFIDYGEDSGPIIGQRAFQIEDDDTIETIKLKGLELEWQLYPECIQKFAHDLSHNLSHNQKRL